MELESKYNLFRTESLFVYVFLIMVGNRNDKEPVQKSLYIDARKIFSAFICILKSLLFSPVRIIYNCRSFWLASIVDLV